MTAAETLRWVASELDAQVEEARQDWVNVLIRSSVRARINTLLETAAMCRTAAIRVEKGEPLTMSPDVKGRKKKRPDDVQEGKD